MFFSRFFTDNRRMYVHFMFFLNSLTARRQCSYQTISRQDKTEQNRTEQTTNKITRKQKQRHNTHNKHVPGTYTQTREAPPTSARVAMPLELILSGVGLSPQVPVKWHGMRMDPPTSLPIASGAHRDETRLASPPLLPPGVRPNIHGFSDRPKMALRLSAIILRRVGFDHGG